VLLHALPICAAYVGFHFFSNPLTARLGRAVCASAAGFLAAAAVQAKAWSYHFYPTDALSLMALGLLLTAWCRAYWDL
jgi:hypothetical protein